MGRTCWARGVSECSEKISGEHVVTKALFPTNVAVRGFPWCAQEFQTIGINSLRAKVLCTRHNSDLSELDAAALDVWCVLREIADRADQRRRMDAAGLHARFSRKRYGLDGTRFERWCFKTMINIVASGSVPDFRTDWEPPLALARYVVEGRALPEGSGLGMVMVIGEKLADRSGMQFQLLRQVERRPEEAPEVEGFLLAFRGLRLAGSSTKPLTSLHTPVNFDNPERVMLRPTLIEFVDIKTDMTFDWTGRHHDASRDVVRARHG